MEFIISVEMADSKKGEQFHIFIYWTQKTACCFLLNGRYPPYPKNFWLCEPDWLTAGPPKIWFLGFLDTHNFLYIYLSAYNIYIYKNFYMFGHLYL